MPEPTSCARRVDPRGMTGGASRSGLFGTGPAPRLGCERTAVDALLPPERGRRAEGARVRRAKLCCKQAWCFAQSCSRPGRGHPWTHPCASTIAPDRTAFPSGSAASGAELYPEPRSQPSAHRWVDVSSLHYSYWSGTEALIAAMGMHRCQCPGAGPAPAVRAPGRTLAVRCSSFATTTRRCGKITKESTRCAYLRLPRKFSS
jgi:hypothetical protein